MSLTDGENGIQAMEYQPIPQLSTELLPGTKVSIWNIHQHTHVHPEKARSMQWFPYVLFLHMKIAHVSTEGEGGERSVFPLFMHAAPVTRHNRLSSGYSAVEW